ncbi:MAG: hypothetical protein KGS61_04560 [Verrucomicrobia bacterium]|nr:hypothetical protein [Verrucomicrobiota bacterium]
MNTKTLPRRQLPIKIKRGNVTVKIYAGKHRVNDTDYRQYSVVYYQGLQRRKRRFADLTAAKQEAELIASKLASGEPEVLRLGSIDRAIYIQALEQLEPVQVPLNLAVLEYVSAVKHLPAGATLKEAVDYYRRRHPESLEQRTVGEVVEEMLAAKRAAKMSAVYQRDLECRLKRFAGAFAMNIGGVSGTMIEAWLEGMKGSGRSKRNYLRVIGTLFGFAIKRKYLPKEALEEISAVQPPREDNGEIEIFTVAEMGEVLAAARPELVPVLAIGGFAGLRSAELGRLDWSEVNLAEGYIEIKARKAKTAARRLAPVTGNLGRWLGPYVRPSGQVVALANWTQQLGGVVAGVNARRRAVMEAAGKDPKSAREFVWRHNGLRHSFCSYRLAAVKSAAQVALEAGNSPQMVFAHYRQLVSEAEAGKWFAIVPEEYTKVIRLAATARP